MERLSIASPNATAKTTSVVGGMLAGADSIDDLDLVRRGGLPRLFNGVRAPSTLGTFPRSFTHGHVQQFDAVGGGLLAGLTKRVPGLLACAESGEGMAFVDLDDTIREVSRVCQAGRRARTAFTGQVHLKRHRSVPRPADSRCRHRTTPPGTAPPSGVVGKPPPRLAVDGDRRVE